MSGVSTVAIVVLAVLAVLVLLALVGAAGASRRNRAGRHRLAENLRAVDRQLAAALAEDRGWERAALEGAARTAFAERRPGAEIAALELTRVVDQPGTDDDLAVFRVTVADGGACELTLGRRDGAWHATAVEDLR